MLSGIFATPTLRNRSGPPSSGARPSLPAPPSGAPLRARRRPSEGPAGLRRQGGPTPRPKAPQRRFQARLRAWEGPRRSGGPRVSLRSLPGRPPGLRRSSRPALRRSRSRCPSGFPFSLFPLCCNSILSTATPRVKPQRCVLRHISRHHKLPNGKTKGSSFQLRTRNLPERNLPTCHLTTQYVTPE